MQQCGRREKMERAETQARSLLCAVQINKFEMLTSIRRPPTTNTQHAARLGSPPTRHGSALRRRPRAQAEMLENVKHAVNDGANTSSVPLAPNDANTERCTIAFRQREARQRRRRRDAEMAGGSPPTRPAISPFFSFL